jgi:SAM-dependent methyltransferase
MDRVARNRDSRGMATADEVERLRRTYAARAERADWDGTQPGNRMILAERARAVARLLERHGFVPLAGRRVLEIGCSHGDVLAGLARLGARPEDLVGVDLLPDRIAVARRRHPGLRFEVGNAEELPFADAAFDLVLAFTVFSSILDDRMSRRVSAEVRRVLRPGGALLWYDFRVDNPRNPDVRGIPPRRLAALFPDLVVARRTLTVLPPLARRLGPATRLAYPLLAALPPLRTHVLALLRRPGAAHASAASRK